MRRMSEFIGYQARFSPEVQCRYRVAVSVAKNAVGAALNVLPRCARGQKAAGTVVHRKVRKSRCSAEIPSLPSGPAMKKLLGRISPYPFGAFDGTGDRRSTSLSSRMRRRAAARAPVVDRVKHGDEPTGSTASAAGARPRQRSCVVTTGWRYNCGTSGRTAHKVAGPQPALVKCARD